MAYTPQMRLLVDAFIRACRSCGYGRKEVAAFLGLSEAQWARQVDGSDGQHVSLYRLALAPSGVLAEWLKAIAPAYGLRALDRRDDILRLVNAVEAQVGSQRRQLRMTLPVERERRRA